MPPIFKALATISVWVLFISGMLGTIGTFIMGLINGWLFVPQVSPPLEFFLGEGLSTGVLILSVCAMKLRQMLE